MKRCSREQGFVAAIATSLSCVNTHERSRLFRNHQRTTEDTTPPGTIVPFRARRHASTSDHARRRDDDAPAAGAGPSSRSLLKDDELVAIEKAFEHGITAV